LREVALEPLAHGFDLRTPSHAHITKVVFNPESNTS
jgi:hypothetical protein